MKVSTILTSALASLAVALPTAPSHDDNALEARQTVTRTDLETGSSAACPKAILIFARGTAETGNMGYTVGPALVSGLQSRLGRNQLWVQGVGSPYTAASGTNFLPEGASTIAIEEMVRLVNLAATKCPSSKIVTGGYSQGAALVAGALTRVQNANNGVANKVVGAALFGYTKNLQYGGRIPSFQTDKTKVFCNAGDMVCMGTLTVLAPHLAYAGVAQNQGAAFLASKIDA